MMGMIKYIFQLFCFVLDLINITHTKTHISDNILWCCYKSFNCIIFAIHFSHVQAFDNDRSSNVSILQLIYFLCKVYIPAQAPCSARSVATI